MLIGNVKYDLEQKEEVIHYRDVAYEEDASHRDCCINIKLY